MNKCLGATLLIAGTSIGAAMIALPISLYQYGMLVSVGIFGFIWIMTLAAGFLIAQVNLGFTDDSNLISMAEDILGDKARWFMIFMYLMLLYSLGAAYLSGLQGMADQALTMFSSSSLPT